MDSNIERIIHQQMNEVVQIHQVSRTIAEHEAAGVLKTTIDATSGKVTYEVICPHRISFSHL